MSGLSLLPRRLARLTARLTRLALLSLLARLALLSALLLAGLLLQLLRNLLGAIAQLVLLAREVLELPLLFFRRETRLVAGELLLFAHEFILPLGAVTLIALTATPFFLKLGKDAGDAVSGRVRIQTEGE